MVGAPIAAEPVSDGVATRLGEARTFRTVTRGSLIGGLGEEGSMSWWVVVLVAWPVISVACGLLFGAVARTAARRERAQLVPPFVPEDWSLTPTR
jgi:hypothetical protein